MVTEFGENCKRNAGNTLLWENSLCTNHVKGFYIVIPSQMITYDEFVAFYNNHLKSHICHNFLLIDHLTV